MNRRTLGQVILGAIGWLRTPTVQGAAHDPIREMSVDTLTISNADAATLESLRYNVAPPIRAILVDRSLTEEEIAMFARANPGFLIRRRGDQDGGAFHVRFTESREVFQFPPRG